MTPVSRLLAILVIPLVAACSARTTAPPPPVLPPLDTEIRGQMATHDALAWSASRPLVWTDFRGVAPTSGMEGAQTAYSLFYGFRCTRDVFQFQVTTGFLPRESWVKPAVLADAAESRRTLEHEQTHFDLSEVHARRMRKYFAELTLPCTQPSDTWRAAAGRFVGEEAAAQDQYDSETRHGIVAARQRTWSANVTDMLASLSHFAK